MEEMAMDMKEQKKKSMMMLIAAIIVSLFIGLLVGFYAAKARAIVLSKEICILIENGVSTSGNVPSSAARQINSVTGCSIFVPRE